MTANKHNLDPVAPDGVGGGGGNGSFRVERQWPFPRLLLGTCVDGGLILQVECTNEIIRIVLLVACEVGRDEVKKTKMNGYTQTKHKGQVVLYLYWIQGFMRLQVDKGDVMQQDEARQGIAHAQCTKAESAESQNLQLCKQIGKRMVRAILRDDLASRCVQLPARPWTGPTP